MLAQEIIGIEKAVNYLKQAYSYIGLSVAASTYGVRKQIIITFSYYRVAVQWLTRGTEVGEYTAM
jgi:hypothetical protein